MAVKYHALIAAAVLFAVVYFSSALTLAQDQETLRRVNTIDSLNQKLDDQATELAAVKTMVGALKQELSDDIYGARQSLVIFFFCLFLAYKTSSSLWTRLFRYHFWRQHMTRKSDLESQALRELTERNRLLTEQGALLRTVNENLMILKTQTGFFASDLQAVVSAVKNVRDAEADAALTAAGIHSGPHAAASCASPTAAVASVKATAAPGPLGPAGKEKAQAGGMVRVFLVVLAVALAAGVAAAVWAATGDLFLALALAGGSVVVLALAWSTVQAVARGRRAAPAVPRLQKVEVTGPSDAHMASPTPEPSSVKPTLAAAEPPKTEEETKSNLNAQTPDAPRAEPPTQAPAAAQAPAEPTPAAPTPQTPQKPPAESPTPEPPQSPAAEEEKRTPERLTNPKPKRYKHKSEELTHIIKQSQQSENINRLLTFLEDHPESTKRVIQQGSHMGFYPLSNAINDAMKRKLIKATGVMNEANGTMNTCYSLAD